MIENVARCLALLTSGIGTNLKVGAPVQSKSGGHRYGAKRWKFFSVVHLNFFLALKVQLVVVVIAFMMVSTVLVSFLFAVLLMVPPCPMESAPLLLMLVSQSKVQLASSVLSVRRGLRRCR